MKFYTIFLTIFLFQFQISTAKSRLVESRFEKVDAHVNEVSRGMIYHPQLLVKKLTENLTNDYDKVRAFYVWIARNIDYDFMAENLNRSDNQNVSDVLRSGKALCKGYSILFKYFCEQAGIETEILEGYAKGFDYKKGQRFNYSNHAWNAVFIHGSWYLLDVTWAVGNPIYVSRSQRKVDLETYFLASPEKFIKTHLPEDPTWQLMENKLSLTDFEKSPGDAPSTISKHIKAYYPQNYEGMNAYDKDILKYKRSLHFNPRNSFLVESLCFAYLYRGISMTDELWKLDFQHLSDTADMLSTAFYSTLDSAWNVIERSKNIGLFKARRVIKVEMNYQKGVFNYELGVELYKKAMNMKMPVTQANEIIEDYFEEARGHFENVPTTCIYLKDAGDYLSYIEDFRRHKMAEKPAD